MAGRVGVDRLIELAVEQLVADPANLQADESRFDALVVEQRRAEKEWTAYTYRSDGASGHHALDELGCTPRHPGSCCGPWVLSTATTTA